MSVNMDSDEMETEAGAYADHEVINFGLTGLALDGQTFDDFQSLEPVADELEANQVAELVYYERNAATEGGSLEFGLGYNVSEGDFLEQAANNNATSDNFGDSGNSAFALYEEPGIIDYTKIGDGDNAQFVNDRREFALRELFQRGPFIDSTDNLDVHVEHENTTGTDRDIDIQFQLVYQIHEVAQGVPQFSDPRRLMD